MSISVVLVHPQIPPNTGNVARLTAGLGGALHLIEPLGFELSDRYLKRAGLDYWSEVKLTVHPSWEEFLASTGATSERMWFLTTKTKRPYWEVQFKHNDFLVFGSETAGLAPEFHERYAERRLCIPLVNDRVRSFNLSSSVAMVVGEANRQIVTETPR